MMSLDIVRICALAVVGALCAVLVKDSNKEVGMVLGIATCVILLLTCLPVVEEIKNMLDEITRMSEISPVIIEPVFKTLGIAIITKLASEICRDAKENGIATFVELSGALAVVLMSLPLLNMVLEMIGGLL